MTFIRAKIIKGWGLLGVSLMLQNCASVTNLQTAETLEKGSFSHTVAGGYGQVDLDSDTGAIGSTVNIDYMLRYGMTDKDEIGLRLVNLASYIGLDYKRKFYDDGTIKLSAGAGLGGTQVTIGIGSNETKLTFLDLSVPLYADYWFSEQMAAFVSPKYMLSYASGSSSSDTYNRVGGSLGMRFGKTKGIISEVGYLKTLSESDADLWQVMLGGFF